MAHSGLPAKRARKPVVYDSDSSDSMKGLLQCSQRTRKRARAGEEKKSNKRGKKDVLAKVDQGNEEFVEENTLDITRVCPNEILTHILSFLSYKEILTSAYADKRWHAIGSSAELWGAFCKKMDWKLPARSKKMTHKSLFLRRISSKTYCRNCGAKSSSRFELLNITLCRNCREHQPEYATLNKTQSKALYLLDDLDLAKVSFKVANTGWGRKKYVYLKSDIIDAALQKYGGQAGFDQALEKKVKAKQTKSDKLAIKKEARAAGLEEELIRIGWSKQYAVGPRGFPILLPSELLNDNYERYLSAPQNASSITQSFAYVFSRNCQRYLDTGFGAMFTANMSVVDQIEAYFEKEKAQNSAVPPPTDDTPNTTTTTTATTTATTATTTATTATTNATTTAATATIPTTPTITPATTTPNINNNSVRYGKVNPRNGRPLSTFADISFDAELRKFYVDIIYTRIEQIWQHPGVYDLPEPNMEEEDHMGTLFDKHSHFCKKLKTPNDILRKIYDDATTAMFGSDSSDDDDLNLFSDSDSDDDDHFMTCPHHGGMFGLTPGMFYFPFMGAYSSDDDDDGGDDGDGGDGDDVEVYPF